MPKSIGLLGGSFDPVHLGHLHLATSIMERHRLDEVWFCPAKVSPHKLDRPPQAPPEHRLAMLKLALDGYPDFSVWEGELRRKEPSYTIDTLRELTGQYDHRFFLILGEDTAASLDSWREPEEIRQLAEILVAPRTPVSSTEIRRCVGEGAPISEYVPEKIIDYIYTHQLYLPLR